LHGITPVGFDPVTRLFGNQGGGDDPAGVAFLRQVPIEPVAAGARFIDEDELLAFGLELPDKLIDITLPGSDSAKGDDFCAIVLGDVGDRDRLFVDISSDIKRARLLHG